MLEISGSLKELFRNRNGIEIIITDKLCESMIERPIMGKNEKVIGVITKVSIEEDKWYGKIFKDGYAEICESLENCNSVSIIIK